ncbi:MAG: DUF6364 family protein [Chitinophagales bacterium]
MKTKFTLSIEQKVIERAKKYANQQGRSLSGLIENYLKTVTKGEKDNSQELAPITKSLKGAFKAPKDFDYKKELSKALGKKHI